MTDIFDAIRQEIEIEQNFRLKISELEKEYVNDKDLNMLNEISSLLSDELPGSDTIFNFLQQLASSDTLSQNITDKHSKYFDKVRRLVKEQRSLTVIKTEAFDTISHKFMKKVSQELLYKLIVTQYLLSVTLFVREGCELCLTSQCGVNYLIYRMDCTTLQIPTYTDYLLALLRFTEDLVSCSTQIIINTSTIDAKEVDRSVKDRRYSVVLVNQKILLFLQNGFSTLDLKNDIVRRKFDGLKYNVKRINNIVYDLSLRNMLQGEVRWSSSD